MNAMPSLLHLWEKALLFRIGEADSAGLDQLPNPLKFPDRFPSENPNAPHLLGIVLGVAVLKLYRPWPVEENESVAIDPCGGWLVEIKEALGAVRRAYGDELGFSCLTTLGCVLDMAARAPERLPLLIQRIDALDGAALHAMAMAAIRGDEQLPDIFAGLME